MQRTPPWQKLTLSPTSILSGVQKIHLFGQRQGVTHPQTAPTLLPKLDAYRCRTTYMNLTRKFHCRGLFLLGQEPLYRSSRQPGLPPLFLVGGRANLQRLNDAAHTPVAHAKTLSRGPRFLFQGSGFRVQGAGCRDQGSGSRVKG